MGEVKHKTSLSVVAQTSDALDETDGERVSWISAAIARGRSVLEVVRAKVGEYDKQYKASETAAAYLGGPFQRARAAFDNLAATASSLKDKTVEIPTKSLDRTLVAANAAIEQITELASKCDDKLGVASKVRTSVSLPQEKCRTALAEISKLATSLSAVANAKLQGVNHGICSRAASIASSSAGMVFSTAAALDDHFDIEDRAVSAWLLGNFWALASARHALESSWWTSSTFSACCFRDWVGNDISEHFIREVLQRVS